MKRIKTENDQRLRPPQCAVFSCLILGFDLGGDRFVKKAPVNKQSGDPAMFAHMGDMTSRSRSSCYDRNWSYNQMDATDQLQPILSDRGL